MQVSTPVAARSQNQSSVNWLCNVPLLSPPAARENSLTPSGEGVSYLYVGSRDLKTNYAVQVRLKSPVDGSRGWYDSGIRLGPLNENGAFVQIEVSHWKRFRYAGHLGIAWAVADSHAINYRDTPLKVSSGSDVYLGIAVKSGVLKLSVNGRSICSATAAEFVAVNERKYFQIRTETTAIGRNTGAKVLEVLFKRDQDLTLNPYPTQCIFEGRGVRWGWVTGVAFDAQDAYQSAGRTLFTGVAPNSACKT